MYTGLIARRYAVALIRFAEESGTAERVYAEISGIESGLVSSPEALKAFTSPLTSERDKIEAVSSLRTEPLSDTTERFLSLVIRHNRSRFIRYILASFCRLYRSRNSIRQIGMTTAAPMSGRAEEEILRKTVGDHSRDEVTHTADASIIGGYILQVDDMVMDCSVRHDLDVIRKKLVSHTRR